MGRIWQTLRQPKTANEKRQAVGVHVRAASRAHRLPSSWDDMSRICEKNWKTYLSTQYRMWFPSAPPDGATACSNATVYR